MFRSKTKVLIGPVSGDLSESVGLLNRSIIAGLKDRYCFVAHVANRPGQTSGRFNLLNCLLLIVHFTGWVWRLIRHRPQIAHYGITSDWNLEKSLLFLRIARLLGARTVGHLHSGDFIEFWTHLNQFRRWLAKRELDRLSALVVLSEAWRHKVVSTVGVDPSKVRVVNNTIAADFENRALHFPCDRDDFDVLCFGVIDEKKGVFDILDAAALLPPSSRARFLLVGPEREPGTLQRIRERLDAGQASKRVVLVGPVFGDDKLKLFASSSVLLLPSYFENFPLTVLEAAAAGLPIVTTPVGATPEFFTHGSSVLFVERGRPDMIAAALTQLESSPEYRRSIGRTGREVFEGKLRREHILASLQAVYEHVIAKTNQSPRILDEATVTCTEPNES